MARVKWAKRTGQSDFTQSYRKHNRERTAIRLEETHHVFRQSPVAGRGKRSKNIPPKVNHGLMRERTTDDYDYGRAKRKQVVNYYYESWQDIESRYEHDWYREKGWKRTKKRKQWM